MPTRAGWIVVVGALVALGAGRAVGAIELYVLASIALALVAIAVVLVRRPVPTLRVHRRVHPARPVRHAPARVEVHLANHGTRRTPVLVLHDAVEGTVGARLVVAPVPPGRGHQLGYRLPTGRRGRLAVGPLAVEVVDPFGLARRRSPGPGIEEITVLPAIEPLAGVAVGTGRHEPLAGASSRAVATTGLEDLATLRPYVAGDDLRRVHWPSSARADDLLVRRDEERWQGHLTVVLDADADAMPVDAFEQAVSAAASLVHAVAEGGDRVRVVVPGTLDSGMVDARRAEGALLEQLALVQQVSRGTGPGGSPGTGDEHQRSAVVLLTGPVGVAGAVGVPVGGDATVVRFATAVAGPGELAVAPGARFSAVWGTGGPSAHVGAAR